MIITQNITAMYDRNNQVDVAFDTIPDEGLLNPLTAGAAYIRVFILYWHIKYHLLNMLKIKCDINQQDLKTVDLHFVKSE